MEANTGRGGGHKDQWERDGGKWGIGSRYNDRVERERVEWG
jgi:hypothetical protein